MELGEWRSGIWLQKGNVRPSPGFLQYPNGSRKNHAVQADPFSPPFSPTRFRYFQSDRDGKPALYCMHVERLVERIDAESRAGRPALDGPPRARRYRLDASLGVER
jgi:hypothetical protein